MNAVEGLKQQKIASCKNCPFWHFDADLNLHNPGNEPSGNCRANPPVAHVVPVETLKGPQVGFQSIWPISRADQWCGKHPERDTLTRAVGLFEAASRTMATS